MKPRAFRYHKATSLQDVYALLGDTTEDPKIISGGQSLVPMMNLRVVAPSLLIDIGGLEELSSVTYDKGVLRIGARVRHRQVETDPLIAEHAPLLRKAILFVAHQVIRNRGTFGGSLCHADPAAEMPACALLLDATMEIGSLRGVREVKADDFFQAPFTTAVEPDEILLGVRIPAAPAGMEYAFYELSRRQGDFAISGVAARASVGTPVWETGWVGFGIGGRPVLLNSVRALFSQTHPENISEAAIRDAVVADVPAEESDEDKLKMKIVLTAELVRKCMHDFAAAASKRRH